MCESRLYVYYTYYTSALYERIQGINVVAWRWRVVAARGGDDTRYYYTIYTILILLYLHYYRRAAASVATAAGPAMRLRTRESPRGWTP